MPRHPVLLAVTFASAAFGGASTLLAEEAPPHRGPPPGAVEACADRNEGDACELQHDGKSVTGVCATTPEGDLACRPDHPPPHHAPPQAAFDACSDAAEGDSCVVSIGGHDVDGTCEAVPDAGLACRPQGPPPGGGHPGGPPPADSSSADAAN